MTIRCSPNLSFNMPKPSDQKVGPKAITSVPPARSRSGTRRASVRSAVVWVTETAACASPAGGERGVHDPIPRPRRQARIRRGFGQEITAGLPAVTQFLSPRLYMNSAATAATGACDCSGVYVETITE